MKRFVSLKFDDQSGVRTRDIRISKQVALTTTPGPLSHYHSKEHCKFVTHLDCLDSFTNVDFLHGLEADSEEAVKPGDAKAVVNSGVYVVTWTGLQVMNTEIYGLVGPYQTLIFRCQLWWRLLLIIKQCVPQTTWFGGCKHRYTRSILIRNLPL